MFRPIHGCKRPTEIWTNHLRFLPCPLATPLESRIARFEVATAASAHTRRRTHRWTHDAHTDSHLTQQQMCRRTAYTVQAPYKRMSCWAAKTKRCKPFLLQNWLTQKLTNPIVRIPVNQTMYFGLTAKPNKAPIPILNPISSKTRSLKSSCEVLEL